MKRLEPITCDRRTDGRAGKRFAVVDDAGAKQRSRRGQNALRWTGLERINLGLSTHLVFNVSQP